MQTVKFDFTEYSQNLGGVVCTANLWKMCATSAMNTAIRVGVVTLKMLLVSYTLLVTFRKYYII